jgi:hypothetical protein
MRIERLRWAIVVLAAGIAGTDALAQGPRPGMPQVGVRSMFGERQLGWPVTPRPRRFGDGAGGVFGPRPDLGRGFSPRPSWSLTEDFPPQPASPNRYSLGIGTRGPQPVPGVPLGQPPAAEATPPSTLRLEQEIGQPEPLVEELGPGADESESPAALPAEGVPGAEPLGDRLGQAAGQPAEPGTQPQEILGGPRAAPVGGIPGGAGSPTPAAPRGGRPSFRWNANSLRMLPAESRLAERLRVVLRDRLRSPLSVSIEHETAILRGAVASQYDRTLAGHLARFEPGVRNVKNELTVAPAGASPSAGSPMRIRLSAE